MKYVRDAASRGVDQDSRRFSRRRAERRPFASDVDQDVPDSRIRQICVRLDIFDSIKLNGAIRDYDSSLAFLETSEKLWTSHNWITIFTELTYLQRL